MIDLLLASVLTTASISKEEQVNRQCSYIVGIPYASDNFNDDEWNRFKLCRKLILKKG